MNQVEDRIPGLKDKMEDLDQTSKKHEQFKKATLRKYGHYRKNNL